MQPQSKVPLVITSPPKTSRPVVVMAVEVHDPETVTAPLKVLVPLLLVSVRVPVTVVVPFMVSVIPAIRTLVAVAGTIKLPVTRSTRLDPFP